jgi:phage terminase large subunit
MSYQLTTATRKLLKLKKRIRAVCGGTSASKTISILMILIDYAQSTENELISVVSESFPHLKRGAMRDFVNIMQDRGYFNDANWNRTDYTYTFETGSKIEFFSADQPSKVRGPRRDVLFLNECNNIPYEAFDQLEVRTKKMIWLDWNPVTEFWFYTDLLEKREDVDFITLTYKDNEGLDPAIVGTIEARKGNKNWWQVYGLGQLGEVEGRIYKDWQIIDEIPHEAQLVRRGMDFGFTNDPTSIVDIYRYNGGYIADERLYRKGMLNSEIASYLQNFEHSNTIIMADSAEPKSIAELQQYNLPVVGVVKKGTTGKSYLKFSIEYVQEQRISLTKRSTNLIKEYRNYLWLEDKDGKILNQPTPGTDHALDALRYAFDGLRPQEDEDVEYTSGSIKTLWY